MVRPWVPCQGPQLLGDCSPSPGNAPRGPDGSAVTVAGCLSSGSAGFPAWLCIPNLPSTLPKTQVASHAAGSNMWPSHLALALERQCPLVATRCGGQGPEAMSAGSHPPATLPVLLPASRGPSSSHQQHLLHEAGPEEEVRDLSRTGLRLRLSWPHTGPQMRFRARGNHGKGDSKDKSSKDRKLPGIAEVRVIQMGRWRQT